MLESSTIRLRSFTVFPPCIVTLSLPQDCKSSGSFLYDMFMGVELNPRYLQQPEVPHIPARLQNKNAVFEI